MKRFYCIFILVGLLYLTSVSAYSGSGTDLDPYLINTCNDFHLLNSDEDYTNKIYIRLTTDIDCSTFSDSYLINKTVNGLDFNGGFYNISNNAKTYFFASTLLTSSDDNIYNLNINNGKYNGLFSNINLNDDGDKLTISNVSIYNSDDSTANCGKISRYLTGTLNNELNINRFKMVNYTKNQYYSYWGLFVNIQGVADSIILNINKMYIDSLHSVDITNAGFLNGYSGDTQSIKEIYINEMFLNIEYTYGLGLDRSSLLSRASQVNKLVINNSFFYSNDSVFMFGNQAGLIGTYDSDVGELIINNTIISASTTTNNLFYTASVVSSYDFDNFYYNNNLTSITPLWTGLNNKTQEELKSTSLYTDWDTDIWQFREGFFPSLIWISGTAPIIYNIDCFNTDYEIYEYSDLVYNINCTTNGLFENYTFDGNYSSAALSNNLTISGVKYNQEPENLSLIVCISEGECENFNVTVSWKNDDILPVCEELPSITIYKNSTFSLPVNCSDNYTNISLYFYSSPNFINTTLDVNNTFIDSSINLSSPNNDFFLYMLVTDIRGNNNTYSRFYTVSEIPTTRNETFKQDDFSTSTSLVFLGVIFLICFLIFIGFLFEIPVLLLFGGVMVLFLGVILIKFSFMIGVSIVLLGIVFLTIALRNIIIEK